MSSVISKGMSAGQRKIGVFKTLGRYEHTLTAGEIAFFLLGLGIIFFGHKKLGTKKAVALGLAVIFLGEVLF